MSDNTPHIQPQDTILKAQRLIWAFMLVGQLVFLGIVAILVSGGSSQPASINLEQTISKLFLINASMLIVVIPICHILRGQAYKKGWQQDAITGQAYAKGNLIFWAGCEAVTFFSIVITYMSGQLGFTLIPAALGLALFVFAFPTGKPLQPKQPDFSKLGK